MSSPHRLAASSLALAAASLAVAAYAVLARPSASEPAACTCDTEALQAQLATLARRLDAAERTAARGMAARVAEAATEPSRPTIRDAAPPADDDAANADDDAANDDADAADDARATPRYASFEVAEPGITVLQSDDGALSVRNTNASLAGQILTVQAVGEDGSTRPIPITVPPVE